MDSQGKERIFYELGLGIPIGEQEHHYQSTSEY